MSQEGWTHESFSPGFPPEFHGMFMFLYDIHEPANLKREGVGVGGLLLTPAAHCVACLCFPEGLFN